MKLRKFAKIILILAALVLALSFVACKKDGALKLESFTVDRTSIKTNYLIGEEIDFSGIKAIAKYSDENLNKIYTYDELTITYAEDITATEGDKEVIVSFNDPHLNVKQETKIIIKVSKEPQMGDNTDPLLAVQFEKPSSLTQFDSNNSTAGQTEYGESGFFGQFAVGGKTYVIGNENEFKLNPQFAVLSEDGDAVIELDSFYSVVEIYVEKNGEFVALTKTAGENNTVTYADGQTTIATVDTYKGVYQFSPEAAGSKVKIAVLPSEEYYTATTPFAPVTLVANVIKAYNVYEAWQLSVVDNYDTAWNEIKAEYGLLGVDVSGIVLHNNIKVTADDIPQSYLYTTDKEVVYTNTIDNSTVTVPAGTKFIKDEIEIYDRRGTAFVIEGNFFLLDTSDFPLVASPAVFGPDAEKDYKSDFSNVTLFAFSSQLSNEEFDANPYPLNSFNYTISNLSLIGNAKRDYLIDANENLASAGGLIFCKSRCSATVTMDNIIGNSYFITYFADLGKMHVSNAKCFDTYQNAAFVWGAATLTFEDSYVEGCGGPVIIAQSLADENWHPTVITTNSLIKTNVEGTEIWFTAVGANTIVGGIKSLGAALGQAGLGTYVDSANKMNITGALMAKGSDAAQIITGISAQGQLFVDGSGMDRTLSAENIHWATIKGISEYAQSAGAQMPPFFTVYDESGMAYTIYFNGVTFVDLAGNALGTVPEHAALVAAFQAAETVTLTQGGLSVVFEFYHN